MAELYQKVYLIFTRPVYTDLAGDDAFYKGVITITYQTPGVATKTLDSGSEIGDRLLAKAQDQSPQFINDEMRFNYDCWYLHSAYTSYEIYKKELRFLVNLYGTKNVKTALNLPLDLEVLPNQ